ncbi:MAG: YifB family Mg chelatase-like AAA ATPase [Gammaproteobacteria bacterium]|nr:MAG: YifB family Mg chelatase-like AAA ATPase [Gammaproteobacteria bacterium]
MSDIAVVKSRAQVGINAPLVTVEVHVSNGLPALSMVGLPEAEVRESKERVRCAIINAGYEFPCRRITINLAPADLPKEGARFDLAIALGILIASDQLEGDALDSLEFLGELALTGNLRPVHGVLPAVLCAKQAGHGMVIPTINTAEATLVNGISILAAEQLLDVCAHLDNSRILPAAIATASAGNNPINLDLLDVREQYQARRALEVAAAGRHNLLLIGPPGTGKSMLASRLPSILPPMCEQEALQAAAIQSISTQGFKLASWRQRPFRSPHHTASAVALVGGGSQPRPGEISLAHQGVLFLDELPEFGRRVLEVMREPLESGEIHISRAARHEVYPARFQLVCAMNPCPCGYLGDSDGRCRCTEEQVSRYRARVSGPLLDRIDLHVQVPRLRTSILTETGQGTLPENSEQVRERVKLAADRQLKRSGCLNHMLDQQQIRQHCQLTEKDQAMLVMAVEKLRLSARAYHRILKVARTIADLAAAENIGSMHLLEALSYRKPLLQHHS